MEITPGQLPRPGYVRYLCAVEVRGAINPMSVRERLRLSLSTIPLILFDASAPPHDLA